MQKLIWDSLHHGFYYNATAITRNPFEATLLSDTEAEALIASDTARRYAVLEPKTDQPEHPCSQELIVACAELVAYREDDDTRERIRPAADDGLAMLRDLGLVNHERALGEQWYWCYRSPRSGTIKFALASNGEQAWQQAYTYALTRTCERGDRSTYAMAAYLRARQAAGLSTSLVVPFAEALNSNPLHTLRTPTYQIGDAYPMTDNDKAYQRRLVLRDMLRKARLTVARRLSGTGIRYARVNGKLRDEQKAQIRQALRVIDCADTIEVAGVSLASAFSLMATSPCLVTGGNSYYRYQLRFIASLDGHRQMVLLDA